MKQLKKVLAAVCAGAMFTSMIAGCSSTPSSSSSALGSTAPSGNAPSSAADSNAPASPGSQAAGEEPFAISILAQTFATEMQKPESPVWKQIEEYTNTKLNITWKPSAGFDENINILVASNDLPMVTAVRDNKAPVIVQAVNGGVFWEIKDDYLQQYPNLSKMNKDVANNVSYDGKIYSLYKSADLARSGWHYRKDWLDKLGLSEPTTLDELYNVIHAFTFNDPDGNGKDDTFGLAMAADIAVKLQFHSMVIAMGGGNEWEADGNGGVQPTFMTQPYIDAMDFFRKIYAEKAMNQDYPSASKNNIYEYWSSGQCGMFYMSMYDSYGQSVQNIKKTIPEAENDFFTLIKSKIDGSYRCYPTSGWKGMYMMSKKAVKSEDDLLKVLGFFDKMEDQAMQELTGYGVEGDHFTVKSDGTIDLINREDFSTVCGDFGQLQLNWSDNKRTANYEYLQKKVLDNIAANEPYAIPNVVNPFISETQSSLGGTLDQMIYDARDKYIIGALDLDGFNAAVAQWRAQGGDNIIKEYSDAYKAAGGK